MYLKIYIDRNVTELTRDIVIKYIEKVTVFENEKIDVILKYENELLKKW